MTTALITGSASVWPERAVPNAVFDEKFGAGVGDWLVKNLAIENRYWLRDDQSVADLVEKAGAEALADAGLSADAIDLFIVATDTPEFISPSTASVVQDRLGLKNAGTFDMNTACAGFVTALDVASKYLIADDRYQHILVIGAYAMSKHLNPDDKKTVTLFADGAAGVVLSRHEADDGRGFLAANLVTEGQYATWMGIYAGGAAQPVTAEVLEQRAHQLVFARKFPKEINPLTWTKMIQELCERLEIAPTDVDHYFFTQLNINSIWETLDNVGVPRERGHTVMQKFGYTGSACIPMAFHDAKAQGKVQPGDLMMFVASGGGLAFAAAAFRA